MDSFVLKIGDSGFYANKMEELVQWIDPIICEFIPPIILFGVFHMWFRMLMTSFYDCLKA